MMISRRKIITSGQPSGPLAARADQVAASSSSSASSRPSNSSHSNTNSRHQHQQQQQKLRQQQQQHLLRHQQHQSQMIKSDDYGLDSSTMSQQHAYEEYLAPEVEPSWRVDKHQVRANQHNHNHHLNHHQPQQDTDASYQGDRFDPYDVDEEDVYGSEQRLFEDHLFEIYNKWPLLDDDIWCKLIIMERNRRIGKAYARVPIVTIDGSHELSYDGYKLALNGFDNPDRDAETEECRKRIGKGVRIKMDNFGNILIKRLSKAGVYVKEWINPAAQVSGGSSNSTNGSSGAGVGRSMPSRQQLIKAASMGGGAHQMSLLNGVGTPTSPASSGDSSMDTPNDSAICDEVINIGGRLSLDKIYVMFDMKKFQANITQELYRAIPDRKKLEQQCFSIVGLTRDSEDILNLPCWIMVINIVAIEMLNERFPPLGDHQLGGRHGLADFTDTRRLNHQPQAPSFVSIFDRPPESSRPVGGGAAAGVGGGARGKSIGATHEQLSSGGANNKEEDPYSMPANASSSDVKSSINDYDTTTTTPANNRSSRSFYDAKDKNSYLAPSRRNAGPTSRQSELQMMRQRSKSNYNIYGHSGARAQSGYAAERYNNSSSIYSPGHMLVPPSAGGDHSVPPKLPPRDFVAKRIKSKSSSNVNKSSFGGGSGGGELDLVPNFDDPAENIYSTRDELNIATTEHNREPVAAAEQAKIVPRKSKKNRFLESLKAPLELAKSSRSASVMGAPTERSAGANTQAGANSKSDLAAETPKKSSSSSKTKRNLRSLLGVGSKSSSSSAIKDSNSETTDSNYVHVDCDNVGGKLVKAKGAKGGIGALPMTGPANIDNTDADSAVDPNEDIDDSQQIVSNSSASPAASYNDLDIPTPDYETDENNYALDEGLQHYNATGGKRGAADNETGPAKPKGAASNRTRRYSTANGGGGSSIGAATNQANHVKSTKDDLYYSGFRAHVPHGINHQGYSGDGAYMPPASRYNSAHNGGDDRMSCMSGSAADSRYLMRTSRMLAAKMSGREKIYGSTLGLHQQQSMTGSRYRSASMQRYYPATTMRPSASHFSNASSSVYDYDYPPHYYHQQRRANRSHTEIAYDPHQDVENPYAMSAGSGPSAMLTTANSTIPLDSGAGHYGMITGGHGGGGGVSRRRSVSKMMPGAQGRGVAAPSLVGSNTNHYDMGRSSSGIYGNNSSSSSSEYADWHPPQERQKGNSSGYLNSIFKSNKHSALSALGAPTTNKTLLATAQMHGSFSNNSGQVDPLNNNSSSNSSNNNNNNNINNNNNNSSNNNNNNNNANSNKALMGGAHAYHQSNNMNVNRGTTTTMAGAAATTKTSSQVRNASSRALKQVTCDNNLTQTNGLAKQQAVSSVLNGPAYRSYDSSNDSDPSYTNSSDGIDIYDKIGSHTRATTTNQRRQHNQFLDHNLAPEVHVGEWENMYDR